jgi:hypothetical protein
MLPFHVTGLGKKWQYIGEALYVLHILVSIVVHVPSSVKLSAIYIIPDLEEEFRVELKTDQLVNAKVRIIYFKSNVLSFQLYFILRFSNSFDYGCRLISVLV